MNIIAIELRKLDVGFQMGDLEKELLALNYPKPKDVGDLLQRYHKEVNILSYVIYLFEMLIKYSMLFYILNGPFMVVAWRNLPRLKCAFFGMVQVNKHIIETFGAQETI